PARAKLWQMLPPSVQSIVRDQNPDKLDNVKKAEVIHALNGVLRTRKLLIDSPEFQTVAATPAVQDVAGELLQQRQGLLKKKQDLGDRDLRRIHRKVLETVLPGVLKTRPFDGGAEWVLSYLGRGEFFGEMGLIQNRPRRATCVAYGQPN